VISRFSHKGPKLRRRGKRASPQKWKSKARKASAEERHQKGGRAAPYDGGVPVNMRPRKKGFSGRGEKKDTRSTPQNLFEGGL